MEELLGLKLAEFLSADYSCSLCQLASSVRPHLYKGPSSSTRVSNKPDHLATITWKVDQEQTEPGTMSVGLRTVEEGKKVMGWQEESSYNTL